mmetsp:Transcript_20388/g.62110  ORF Transcript_20388/g.62110 Transcript_20388/m.62110 type:complete len:207 (-) Transcript_20388:121-741(-)
MHRWDMLFGSPPSLSISIAIALLVRQTIRSAKRPRMIPCRTHRQDLQRLLRRSHASQERKHPRLQHLGRGCPRTQGILPLPIQTARGLAPCHPLPECSLPSYLPRLHHPQISASSGPLARHACTLGCSEGCVHTEHTVRQPLAVRAFGLFSLVCVRRCSSTRRPGRASPLLLPSLSLSFPHSALVARQEQAGGLPSKCWLEGPNLG